VRVRVRVRIMNDIEEILKQQQNKNEQFLKENWKILNTIRLVELQKKLNESCPNLNKICNYFKKLKIQLKDIETLSTNASIIEYEIKWRRNEDSMEDFKEELEKNRNKLRNWKDVDQYILRLDRLIDTIEQLTYGIHLNYLAEKKGIQLKQECLDLINKIISS